MIWAVLGLMCVGIFGTVFFSLELRQTRIDEEAEIDRQADIDGGNWRTMG